MWPFNSRRGEPLAKPQIEKDGRFLGISSLDYFGPYSESVNGRYVVTWSDKDPVSGRSGFRESGDGTYMLLLNDQVIVRGQMERPNDGRVANNGTFVLNDWMFGEGLNGIFYAIDSEGHVLVKQRFEANLLNNGIAPDGRFAVCQTLDSDGALCLFDLRKGNLIWSKAPETGWTWDYEFDTDRGVIRLRHETLGQFAYSMSSGEFLDKDLWIARRIEHGSGFELFDIAKERLRQLGDSASEAEHSEILDILGNALNRGLEDYPNQQAAVLRATGEIHERMGNLPLAICSYEEAIKQNPKVGVKRKLKELRQDHERWQELESA